MKVTRSFDENGESFEKMFHDLVNSKVDDFVNKKYTNKLLDCRERIEHV